MTTRRADAGDRAADLADASLADASLAAGLEALRALIDAPPGIDAQPGVDLLASPELAAVVGGPGSAWTVGSEVADPDGTVTVDLRWSRAGSPDIQAIRAAAIALIGQATTSTSIVRQHGTDDGVEFEVVTGSWPSDVDPATRGASLRVRVQGPEAVDVDPTRP